MMRQNLIPFLLILLGQNAFILPTNVASSANCPSKLRNLTLPEATQRARNLHESFIEPNENEACFPAFFHQLTPDHIDSFPHGYNTSNEMIIDYAVSFMNVTSSLLDLKHVDRWKRWKMQGNSRDENALTPTSLLRAVDNVLKYVVGYSDLVGANGEHTVQPLMYNSSEMQVVTRNIVSRDGVVEIDGSRLNVENVHDLRSSKPATYTVVSVTYKTLPTLIGKTLALTQNQKKNYISNNTARAFDEAGGSLCQDLDYSLADSLCSLKQGSRFQNNSRQLNLAAKRTWSFLPNSSIRSITAYRAYHNVNRKKISVPVKFAIETFPSRLPQTNPGFNSQELSSHTCVFYNTTLNKWSDKGCSFVSRNNESFSCFCNHTTNFAILVLIPVDFTEENKIPYQCGFGIEIVSYCAGAVSAVFLTLSIAFFAFTMQGSQRIAERNVVHLCLAVSMLLLHTVLIVDDIFTYTLSQDGVMKPYWLCTIIAFMTHFFLLCNFTWMTVEGVLLYRNVVDGNLRKESLGKWKLVVGWVFPSCIAGITLITGMSTEQPYLQPFPNATIFTDDSPQPICYLSRDLVWAAFVPMLISVTINLVITILVARVIARLTKESISFRPSSQVPCERKMNIKVMKKSFVAFCKLYPTLGILWMLSVPVALFQYTSVYCVLQIVHHCLNGMQGAFLFLITIMQSNENRSILKSRVKIFHQSAISLMDYLRAQKSIPLPFSSAENRTSSSDLRSDKMPENKNVTIIF